MKLTPNTGDYRKHKAGQIYQANIVACQVEEGDYGMMFFWDLKGPEIEENTRLVSSTTLSKKSKLGKWVALVFPGYDFEKEFDTDSMLGEPVAVVFEHIEDEGGGWKEKGAIVARGSLPVMDVSPDLHPDEAPF